MNNMPWPPYMFNPIPTNQLSNTNFNMEEELSKIKKELEILNNRITDLEKKDKNNYLDKNDGLYMM